MGRRMKKIGIFVFVNVLIVILTLPVMGAELPPSSTPAYLSIETKSKYDNMGNSYQNGYEPTVKEGKVILVLPLKVEAGKTIDNNTITSSLKVTDGTTVPFKMRSYEKEFKIKNVKTDSGKSQDIYLVMFTLPLKKDRINGSYPVTIQTKYKVAGEEVTQDFQLYINIKDGTESSQTTGTDGQNMQGYNEASNILSEDSGSSVSLGGDMGESAQSSTQENSSAPKLMVTNCSVSPEKPKAGEEVTFKLVLENKSSKAAIKNLKLTYASDSGELSPIGTQSSTFIDSINTGGSQTVTFKMKVADVITTTNQKITLSAEYEDKNGTQLTGTESLYVKIDQPFSVFIDKAVINAEVESGKKVNVTIKIFNTGKVAVKNVMCSLNVDGLVDGGATFIGDIEPGASAQGTISAAVTQKSLGKEGVPEEDKYGSTEGALTVKYEDLSGKSYQEDRSVRTKIKKASKESNKEVSVKRSSQWSVSLVIGMAFIYVMSGIGFLAWKRRQP